MKLVFSPVLIRAILSMLVISIMPIGAAMAQESPKHNRNVSSNLPGHSSTMVADNPTPPGEMHTDTNVENGNVGICTIDLVPIGSKLADLDYGFESAVGPINYITSTINWYDGANPTTIKNTSIGAIGSNYPADSVQHEYTSKGFKTVTYSATGFADGYILSWTTFPFNDSDNVF